MADEILELWADVVGYEDLYSVSNFGRVAAKPRTFVKKNGMPCTVRGRHLKTFTLPNGYVQLDLRKDNKAVKHYVHRLVLTAFSGPPLAGQEACHANGVRKDNRLANLRWDTRSNNHKDKGAHGTAPWGENCGTSKLTAKEVLAIRSDRRPSAAIAADYGVSPSHVCGIKRLEYWAHLP